MVEKKRETPLYVKVLVIITAIVGVLIIVSIFLFSLGVNTNLDKIENEFEETNKEFDELTSKYNESKNSDGTEIYKIGDKVQLGDNIVTIYSMADYKESNEFMQPEAGNKFIAIDVGVENGGKEAIDYNLFDFNLQDNKDYTYEPGFASKEPSLSSGTLQPGRKARGFIVYEIPTENTATDIIFTPSFWGTDQIIISVK